jgi:hypothetical protein
MAIIIIVIVIVLLTIVTFYFDYYRWFGSISSVTGRSINPLYFVFAVGCLAAGRFISFDAGNPIGLIFYLAGATFFIIAVYGIITKIK